MFCLDKLLRQRGPETPPHEQLLRILGSFQSEVPGHCQLCHRGGDTPQDYPWRRTVEDLDLGLHPPPAPASVSPLTPTAVLPQPVVLRFSGASGPTRHLPMSAERCLGTPLLPPQRLLSESRGEALRPREGTEWWNSRHREGRGPPAPPTNARADCPCAFFASDWTAFGQR